jgi:hypothetical protein
MPDSIRSVMRVRSRAGELDPYRRCVLEGNPGSRPVERRSRHSRVLSGRTSCQRKGDSKSSYDACEKKAPGQLAIAGALLRHRLLGTDCLRAPRGTRRSRMMPGIWVDTVGVSERRPRSYSARQARFSMATGVLRWSRKRLPTRTGAAAISAPTSPRANSRIESRHGTASLHIQKLAKNVAAAG